MKVLVLGASPKIERYSNRVVKALKDKGHEVIALGKREFEDDHIKISSGFPSISGLDTITLYLNPSRQEEYFNYLIDLKPRRIIFNPGTENFAFEELAQKNGIQVEVACTLVLLSINQF